MLNLIRNTVSNFRTSKATQDSNAFLAAAGITGQVQSQAIYNLVNDLQASGLWSKMKAVYPMVTDNKNVLSYTEDFTNAIWTRGIYNTISVNSIISPDGTQNADKIQSSATGNELRYVTQLTSPTTGTYSIYAKAGEVTEMLMFFGNANGIFWDLTNGSFISYYSTGASTISSYSSQSVGNGWYRYTMTSNTPVISAEVYMSVSSVLTSNIPVGNGFYLWGAQLQVGALTTYQPILTTPSAFMASQMKYNLKDARDLDAAFRLTWSGGWTYSATGATPNGTNAYADTKYSPNSYSSNGVNYGIYTRNTATGTYPILMGGYNNDSKYFYVGGGGESYLGAGASAIIYSGLSSGYYIRNGNSTGQIAIKNNTLIGTNASAAQYTTTNIYLAAINTTGSGASNFSNGQICFSHFSESLTQQEGFLLNQIVEKYQVALSRGVQAAQSFYYNSAYSNEANTYLYSTQITGTTQVSAINTLINGLKANNLWTKMKAVYPFVTDKINLIGYTEDFSNAVWGASSTIITANDRLSPTGTLTADKFVGTVNSTNPSTNNGSLVYYVSNANPTIAASNNTVTGSVYIYATSAINVQLFLFEWGGSAYSQNFTLTPNTWQRISSTATFSGGSGNVGLTIQCNANTVWCWGAQLELGSNLSTYQPILAANNYATNVAAQMKFNLVNPQDTDAAFRLAFSGGWTYSTNGAQPNGTNGYADTKLVTGTELGNDISFSIYSRTTGASTGRDIGYDGTFIQGIICQYNGATAYFRNGTDATYAVGTAQGFFVDSKNSTTGNKGYINGANVANSAYQSVITNLNAYIGALQTSGTPNFYSIRQNAFTHFGTSLTDAEVAILYSLVQQFQTTLNRQV